MRIEPKRKWISVSMKEEKEAEEDHPVVLLPDDYRPSQNPHKTVFVEQDPEGEYLSGARIVVPAQMIREVKVKDHTFHLVERNFIMASVEG